MSKKAASDNRWIRDDCESVLPFSSTMASSRVVCVVDVAPKRAARGSHI